MYTEQKILEQLGLRCSSEIQTLMEQNGIEISKLTFVGEHNYYKVIPKNGLKIDFYKLEKDAIKSLNGWYKGDKNLYAKERKGFLNDIFSKSFRLSTFLYYVIVVIF